MSETYNVMINDQLTDIAELKVAQLKIELKKRGISTAGNKQELHDKLKAHLTKEQNDESILNESLTTKQHNAPAANLSKQSDSFIELEKDLVSNNETSSSFNEHVENHKKEQQIEQALQAEKLKQQKEEEEEQQQLVNDEKPKVVITSETNDYTNSIMTPTLSETDNSIKNGEVITETNNKTNEQESADSRETSTERSESCIKEVPMSGDRNRFSRSKSPKPRWQSDSQPQIQSTDTTSTTDQEKKEEVVPAAVETAVTEEIKQQTETVLEDSLSSKPDEATTTTSTTENEMPKVQRKRKWLSNESANILTSKKQLTISSDTLKSYLPTNTNENKSEEDQIELTNESSKKVFEEQKSNDSETTTITKAIIRQTTRTVILEENNDESVQAQDISNGTLANGNNAKADHASFTPSTKPISNILHIVNLTRPFTLNQFKELLTKFGPLKKLENSDEHYFWINSVKSHCYVAFENETSATLARQGLNNTTWPQSNPKQLQVEYSTMDDLLLHMNENNKLPLLTTNNNNSIAKQNIQKQISQILNENEESKFSTSAPSKTDRSSEKTIKKDKSSHDTNNEANNNKSTKVVREWDLPKLSSNDSTSLKETRKHSDEHAASHDKSSEQRKKPKIEEAPPKTLDDLFKKTTALPHIYWLPLTDEQFIERQKDNERRNLERIKRAEERLLKETEAAAAATSSRQKEQSEQLVTNGSDIKEEVKKETNGDAKESSEQVVRSRPRDDDRDRRDYRSDKDSDRYKRRPLASSGNQYRSDDNNDRNRNYSSTKERENNRSNRYASPDRNKKDDQSSRRKRSPSNNSRSSSSSGSSRSSSSSRSRSRSKSKSKNSFTKEKKSTLSVHKDRN